MDPVLGAGRLAPFLWSPREPNHRRIAARPRPHAGSRGRGTIRDRRGNAGTDAGLSAPAQPAGARSGGHLGHARQRRALVRHGQSTAQGEDHDPHAGRERQLLRKRRAARPGALSRAHGLQRHHAFPPGQARRGAAGDGARVRRAHQRAHQLRRDGVQARPAGHPREDARDRTPGDGRLGGRDADPARGGREGARRHPRRDARPQHAVLP